MKIHSGTEPHSFHSQGTELNSRQTTVNRHSKRDELASNGLDTPIKEAKPKQGDFNALLAVEEFDINNISPQEFTSLIADITRLSSETDGKDDSSIEGLSHFRVSLEVRMSTGQLDPTAKLDMEQYINDYTEQAEKLSKQDNKTYGYSPIYANQSKQSIETIFTQSNLESLQLEAIEFLKSRGSNLVDKKV